MSQLITGINAAVVTTFREDGSIDYAAYAALIKRLIANGVTGIVPCGSTGEFTDMTIAERKKLIEVSAELVSGTDVLLIPQTGAVNLHEAKELTEHALDAGADALLVMPPYFCAMDFKEVFGYFEAIAAISTKPIALYHGPFATGVTWTFDQVKELGSIDGIELIKDSSGNGNLLGDLVRAERLGGMQVLNGNDALAFYAFAQGASSCILGLSNVVPAEMVQLRKELSDGGSLEKAREIWDALEPLASFSMRAPYTQVIKAAGNLLGQNLGHHRAPTLPLDASLRGELEQIVADLRVYIDQNA